MRTCPNMRTVLPLRTVPTVCPMMRTNDAMPNHGRRGANLQKFVYKRSDGHRKQWLGLQMRVVPGTRLLCSGFWGLSRHVNFLGEILQATALSLPGSLVAPTRYYALLPWVYPLYYIALFVPRQLDDDAQLEAKYGKEAFAEYVRRVPYRIIPGVY